MPSDRTAATLEEVCRSIVEAFELYEHGQELVPFAENEAAPDWFHVDIDATPDACAEIQVDYSVAWEDGHVLHGTSFSALNGLDSEQATQSSSEGVLRFHDPIFGDSGGIDFQVTAPMVHSVSGRVVVDETPVVFF